MSKRQVNREEICLRILEAAEVEFGLKGYNGASLQHIAETANLPKANIVYYFESKLKLYKTVLNRIATIWNDVFDKATVEDDPAVVLDEFIRTKLAQSIEKPRSSRIFAMEVMQGAHHIDDFLTDELKPWFQGRVAVIEGWIAQGKMKQVNPENLIFMIWSSTQHYADFESQIVKLTDQVSLNEQGLESIGDTISQIILTGCGLQVPTPAESK
ncbi:TetR family transcriptional regulator C-terminal domain-containing protein [Marinomonas sp. 15G1-11]|uniref:TetR family transcriptional regulator C-terminal domain-containing protein n=1 Tax=Marinomonas phaeophyticola TaxID=3004091 RepID=A0ABT4JY77_9GAMM|nr:TetR family transcriptional regulator C-terminal domain-containing protein [Marinomonas sp. 15G1-11]MCZ2722733.1 TetR family transcriptional regulator C-terminal domain-containing protein [Marinomonas sp. 15G1-11]